MSNLYIITGPPGVGKSTISKSLANKLNKSVLLEGDDIYHHVVSSYVSPWKEGNHLDVFWKVSINTIKTYLESGYDVVFNYIIKLDDLKKLENLYKSYNTKFTVLLSSEETLLKRDKERPEDCRMNERCLILLKEFIDESYPNKNILYTDNLSVEDITNKIIEEDAYKLCNFM